MRHLCFELYQELMPKVTHSDAFSYRGCYQKNNTRTYRGVRCDSALYGKMRHRASLRHLRNGYVSNGCHGQRPLTPRARGAELPV